MKFRLVFILFIFTSTIALAQPSFYVLHVRGKVTNIENKIINPRDKLHPNDQLIFSSDDDFVVVFSSTEGRKIIKPVRIAEMSKNFISYFLEENIFPIRQEITTRGMTGNVSSFEQLQSKFMQPFVILQQYEIPVDMEVLGLNDDIYMQVEDLMNLPATDSSFIINDSIPTGVYILYQVDEDFRMRTLFAYLKVVNRNAKELKEEIDYYQQLSGKNLSRNEVRDYLEQTMGSISEDDLNLLMEY